MALIDESYIDNEYYDRSISTNALGEIWDGSQIHPELNTRDSRLKIRDYIKQTKNKWKGAEISVKSIVKDSHKVFNDVGNEINNSSTNLG